MDFKESSVKWFGEDFTGVCLFDNVFHLKKIELCYQLPHKVISQVDMFGSFVGNRLFIHVSSTDIIDSTANWSGSKFHFHLYQVNEVFGFLLP